METLEPNDPETHSITPSSSTNALFVFKLYIFLDQFSIVEYRNLAPFFTINSTAPAWSTFFLYFGAEHPSIKCKSAPSSTIISVCSNCPASGAFNLKYDWSGIFTFTPFGT